VQEGHCRCFINVGVDLDLLALSVHYVPPHSHRACSSGTWNGTAFVPKSCGNPECASAISSINDTALSLMKTGFTVCLRRVLAAPCTRSKRLYMRALSGVRPVAGRAKRGVGGADAATRAGLRRAARRRLAKGSHKLRNQFQFSVYLRSSHGMRSPREHRDTDARGARHLRRSCHPIYGPRHVSLCA
jgi:hypothetical protein